MAVFYSTLVVLIIGAGAWVFWRKGAIPANLKPFFWPAFFLKAGSGLLIGFFFGGIDDTFEFQYAADRMTKFAGYDFGGYLRLLFTNDYSGFSDFREIYFNRQTNSFFIAKIISLLNFVSGGNYYLNSLFFSFFSFSGCWFFIQTLSRLFPFSLKAGVIAFLFFPSVVFWSSGIMKESLLLGSLGFFWGAVLNCQSISFAKKWPLLLLLMFSGWLLWKVRFFLAAVVFFLTGSWLLLSWSYHRFHLLKKFASILVILPVLSGATLLFIVQKSEVFDLNFLFRHIVWDYNDLLKLSLNKPHIQYSDLQPTFWSILKNTPEAIFSSFFRPFLGESFSPVYLVAGLENLALLVLVSGSVFGFFKYGVTKPNQFYALLVCYILIMAVFLTLPTPNLGTLNRYRVAFLPFAVFLLLQTPFWQKTIEKIARKFRFE